MNTNGEVSAAPGKIPGSATLIAPPVDPSYADAPRPRNALLNDRILTNASMDRQADKQRGRLETRVS